MRLGYRLLFAVTVLSGALVCGAEIDSTPQMQARLASVPDGGTLKIEKGIYHFFDDHAKMMWLDPSNNQSGEKQVVFPLVGRHNVTIDGGGSTFVFHGRTFPFAATNCTGLVFRNFTVTTRFPSCAGFTVLEKAENHFKIKFDDGVCPYAVENGNLVFRLDGYEVRTVDGRLSLHSLDRLAIFYLMTPDSKGDKSEFPSTFVGVTPQDLGNGVVMFTYYGDKHPKSVKLPYNVGEKVVVNLEEKRYRDVFFFEDCENVVVEDVAIDRFGGMGVVGQRSGNIRVQRLTADPPKGERVSLTADIVQFINCFGKIDILDCAGGFSLDDWINIHGNYLRVERVEGNKVHLRAKHLSHQGFFPYRSSDTLEFVTAHERALQSTAKVVSVVPDPADRFCCTVLVDGTLPSTVKEGLLVENATLNPDVTIRGNHFHDYPNLRLSGRGRYLVEDNRFVRGYSAVIGMDLADYWYESGRISDMTIRGNTIEDCGGLRFGLSGWRVDEPGLPKIHGRIRLEGNVFKNVRGGAWSPVGVSDFSVR